MDATELRKARERYCRRADWHDYRAPHFYHITIYKKADADVLSIIPADPYGIKPHEVSFQHNGLAFVRAVAEFRQRFDFVCLSHYVVMPDHVHFIVEVRESTPYHLGHYMKILMYATQRYAGHKVFENKYTDKILYHKGQLRNWINYIHDNPRRLQIRRKCRELFQNRCVISIKDPQSDKTYRFTCFGNIFLLKYPERLQVRYSRSYSSQELERHREMCRRIASQQGVIVSPFIHNIERDIRRECLEAGASVIYLYNESLPPRFKPSGADFDLCASGRLLIIAPTDIALSKPLSRQACMILNSIAAYIATIPSWADMSIQNIAVGTRINARFT